jgi:hypothetical protein
MAITQHLGGRLGTTLITTDQLTQAAERESSGIT